MKKTLFYIFLTLIFQFGFFKTYAQWLQTCKPYGGVSTCLVTKGTNIFIGTNDGVFLSTNNGSSWAQVNNGLTDKYINSLAVSGANIFAGTSDGVFLSTNNGISWTQANNGLTNINVYLLVVSGNNIFAISHECVFLSTNNGSSWTKANNGLPGSNIFSLVTNGTNIFVLTGSGAFLSTNNGNNWVPLQVNNKNVGALTISGTNVFASTGDGVFLSTNNGSSWAQVNNVLKNINSLAVSGTNIFAGTYDGVFLSTNNGSSWTQVNNGLNNKSIIYLSISGTNIFAGTTGGIYLSTNNGNSWAEVNTGFIDPNFTSLVISGSNIYAGSRNDGVFLSSNNGKNWLRINNGLPNTFISSLALSGLNIFAGTNEGMALSTNNGSSWISVNNGLTNTSIRSIAICDTNIFCATGDGVFLSTNNGSSWTQVNIGLTNLDICSLATNGTNIFAGTRDGVFLSTNQGGSWTKVNSGLQNITIRVIAISGSNIYVGTGDGVFLSTNNGNSWKQVNNGLTDLNIYSLAISGTNILTGTEKGVFISSNSGSNWTQVNDGLTNGIMAIYSLATNGTNILAGAWGTGLWIRPINEMITVQKVYPTLNLNPASLNAGETIVFTGKNFRQSGTVNLTIQGPGGFSKSVDKIATNSIGGFSYSFPTTSVMPAGVYNVITIDNSSGYSTPIQKFTLKTTSVLTNNLKIVSLYLPNAGNRNELSFEWIDIMVKNKCYLENNDHTQRCWKYIFELSDNNGSTWKKIPPVDGLASYDKIDYPIHNTFYYTFETPGRYIIRITDFYNPSNTQSTPVITVNQLNTLHNLKMEKNWDFSFPQPIDAIKGVAADGTARIFLNLSKKNNSLGLDISSVKVTLSDDYNGNDPTKLGRVKVATQTQAYSSEANGIISISATDNTPKKTNYIFWYVAPDDFVGSNPVDARNPSRLVNITFTVTYADNTTESYSETINIVRPPLMLVHGLASGPNTWDDFRYSEYGSETIFIKDVRFMTRKAVKVLPAASFKMNAGLMTNGTDENSFQGVINDIRNQGYAANRVDYVCHSMGGCVLRSIYDNYLSDFIRTGNASNSLSMNYEKGFVNKVVMIGTPNNSSPWADIIKRYVGDLDPTFCFFLKQIYSGFDKALPFMFIIPEEPNSIFNSNFKVTDAINDLQIDDVQGGINFKTTNTKAHLIAGDFMPGEQLNTNGLIPQEIISTVKKAGDDILQRFLFKLLEIAVNKEKDPDLKKALLDILESKVEPITKALEFLDKTAMVMDAFNVGTFLPESDLVVSVGSALAGYPRPVANAYKEVTNVSVYDQFVGHAFIRPETKNVDIGNRVNFLLNSSINSSLFDIIPATPPNRKAKSSLGGLNNNAIISKIDTNKLQIIYPLNNTTVQVDSSFHIKIIIKDTTNLKSVNLSFQDKTYFVDSLFLGNIDMQLQINSNQLDNQKIVLEGFYNYPDSGVFVYDQKNINIVTIDTLTGFRINPKVMYLFKNQIKQPEYQGIYKNTITTGNFSPDINAIVSDTSIVRFDKTTKGFIGIAAGGTFAKISYKGFSDTLYFNVSKTAIDTVDHSLPDAAGVITGNVIICKGGTETYSVQDIKGATSYIWTFPSGLVGSSNTNTITVSVGNSALSGIIKVKGRNIYGDGTESTLTFTVNDVPIAAGSITGNSIAYKGTTETYTIPSITGATSYIWTLPTGFTGSSTTNSITITVGITAITGIIKVKGVNICGNGNENSITVTPLSIPPTAPTSLSAYSCGKLVTLKWKKGIGADIQKYRIYGGLASNPVVKIDSTLNTSSDTIKIISGLKSDQIYFFRMTAVNMDGSESLYSSQISIKVIKGVTPKISVKWGDVFICSNINDSIVSYQWLKNGVTLPGAVSQYYAANKIPGIYSVKAIDRSGCTAFSNAITITGSKSLSLYPNPTKVSFAVSVNDKPIGKAFVSILNAGGIKVMEFESSIQNNELMREISVSNLKPGVYVVRIIMDDKELYYSKVVVIK